MTDESKNSFNKARHDYGFRHGFNSRGIAPSFLGSDSLPQGIADLHWALHGVQDNMDKLDAKMDAYEGSLADEANKLIEESVKSLGDIITASKTALTNNTGYISKVLTSRTRIFSDSFGPETLMDPSNRISGFTHNYRWIQYNQLNPTCEGEYDKIIDFDYVTDRLVDDGVDSMYVTKGKITLDKCGLINRMFITQHGTNIVIYYLLTQSVPTETGVAYTGAIKRVEYDQNANLVSERFLTPNHTPLVLLGAFNSDSNDESDFVQYISTDYKVYQLIDGTDYEIGQLPNDVIMLIDPVNDIVSDTKQAYIMTYDNNGKLKMPLQGFTLVPTLSGTDILKQFEIITFKPDGELFNNIVSISPRTQTSLTQANTINGQMVVEGGYFVEVYDNNNVDPNVNVSHNFLLSSTEEVYDLERFASNMFSYHMDSPSEFGLKRERDYTEFCEITFKSGATKMFPEVTADLGIPDSTTFTLMFDHSRQSETVTFWLDEPFTITRSIASREVNSRLGYTVLHNSDNVKDVADTNYLSVYKDLDFTIKTPATRNYLSKLANYTSSYALPEYMRYRVVSASSQENSAGIIEVSYFDKYNNIVVTYDAPTKVPVGNQIYSENDNIVNVFSKNVVSPTTTNTYLAELHGSDRIYLGSASSYSDKPYGSDNFTLENSAVNGKLIQTLTMGNNSATSDNKSRRLVTFKRTVANGYPHEWTGNGVIDTPMFLHIPGQYDAITGFTTTQIGTSRPDHAVFSNIVSHKFEVEDVDNLNAHVIYTITNNLGLVMQYHNLAVRQSREDKIPSTAKSYDWKFSKWIPGEYVGNDDYPLGPDNNSVTKELLRRIAKLGAQDLTVTDTNSIDLTLSGSWESTPVYNASTGEWEVQKVYKDIKADSKISTYSGTKSITVTTSSGKQTKTVNTPNAITVRNDGHYAPDYGVVIDELSTSNDAASERVKELETKVSQLETQLTETTNALKQIVKDLIDSGAWDSNATSDSASSTSLKGGLKSDINVAYGNINLFGGSTDGSSYIRTNSGSTENDLAGGI